MKQDIKLIEENYLRDSISEVSTYIDVMLQNELEIKDREISKDHKFLYPITFFVKKRLLRFLIWFIEPLLKTQKEFNNAVRPFLGKTRELINVIGNKNIEQDQKLLQQEQKLVDLNIKYEDITVKYNEVIQKYQNLEKNQEELKAIINKQNDIINSNSSKLELLDKLNISPDTSNFFVKSTFSQTGEDSILSYIIKMLGIPFEEVFYVDLGANHAREMSNTYFFYTMGARGILVEANPHLIPELKFYRHRDLILNYCIHTESGREIDFYILNGDGLSTPDYNTAVDFCKKNPNLKIIEKCSIETITFNDIIKTHLGKAPTILSIDIEGYDIEVLKSINYDIYRPTIIVIEMIQYDTDLAFKTKNEDIIRFLESKNYDEYAFTGINSIFIDRLYLLNR